MTDICLLSSRLICTMYYKYIDLCGPDVSPEDVVYDLGCGDGRICVAAAQRFGCKATGVEIEEDLIEQFKALVAKHRLDETVRIIHGDLLELDLSDATIIVLYLLSESIELIKPKLIEAINRGCIIICNTFTPKGLTPCERKYCGFANNVTLFKYDRTSLPS
jgi:ubiquinone/menaquinone biosynthesis C-methylase UbiE